jgi:SAM-dependent methyltransferase
MLVNRPASTVEPDTHTGVTWEETPCLLCGRDETDVLTEAADPLPPAGEGLRFAVTQCRHCGLAYTNPRPTADSIGRFYPSDYEPHAPRVGFKTRRPSRFWSRIIGRPCPERRGLLPWAGTGRLLDFGCGGGSYLKRMADFGWRVTGLDVSPRVVRTLRHELGFDAHLGTLPHNDLSPGSFDVITMWQALEHVHQPLEVLRAAYELLIPGGKLIVAVPNFDGIPSRWFREHWFGLDLPRHLTHFSPWTLREMLSAGGFRVESIRGIVHADWLRTSAARAAEAQGSRFGRLLRWKPASRVAAWLCYALGRSECLVAVAERPE